MFKLNKVKLLAGQEVNLSQIIFICKIYTLWTGFGTHFKVQLSYKLFQIQHKSLLVVTAAVSELFDPSDMKCVFGKT